MMTQQCEIACGNPPKGVKSMSAPEITPLEHDPQATRAIFALGDFTIVCIASCKKRIVQLIAA